MELEISKITVEVKDRSSGRVHRRELAPGAAWPCSVEDLEAMSAKGSKRSSSPKRGDPSPTAEATAGAEKDPESSQKTAKPKATAKKASTKKASAKKTTSKKASAKKTTSKKSSPKKAPKKKTSKALDLSTIEAREAYDKRILEVVQNGPTSVAAVYRSVGGDRMQALGGLARLVDAGLVERRGSGRGTRYRLPDGNEQEPETVAETPTPTPKAEVLEASQERVRLRWRYHELMGRETLAARYGAGAFRLVPMLSGSHGLFYEDDDDKVLSYGCGEIKALKEIARELATAGLPDPEVFRANGGTVAACPPPKRMRLGDVELTWRESIKDGRQLCVAPTGEGELRVMESDGGSFVLVFVREGDTAFDTLGCGSREDLELRALSLLAETADDTDGLQDTAAQDAAAAKTGASEPTKATDEPVDEPAKTNETSDQEKEDRLVGSFASAAKQLMESM